MSKHRRKRSGRVADWERLLAQAAMLQTRIPGAVLVGGTAAAVHARHRISLDHDHVIQDLARNYDSAIAALESMAGWRTQRRIRGKLVLGRMNDIDAGLRNQRRSAPLETMTVDVGGGRGLKLPTIEEMLRIKAYLVVERNATRDYLDVAALSHRLGLRKSATALDRMNELYAEFAGEGGDMLGTVLVKLSNPDPYDRTHVDLTEYKGLIAPWNDWQSVVGQCRALALALLDDAPGGPQS
ncbi:MAG TPA: hypothetical protein VFN79_01225 [Steroidobacteraceae bacterium]|nr:hypothetical protein [Steroidobacteraceae bacterium]